MATLMSMKKFVVAAVISLLPACGTDLDFGPEPEVATGAPLADGGPEARADAPDSGPRPDAPKADSGAPEAEAGEPDAGGDEGALEAGEDAGSPEADAEEAEAPEPSWLETACKANGPRLSWTGKACRDVVLGFDCALLTAEDGVGRCLPAPAVVAGYKSSTCLPVDVGYLNVSSFSGGGYASMIVPATGRYQVVQTFSVARPTSGTWSRWALSVCTPQLVPFPHANPAGQSLLTGPKTPASAFVAL